MGAVPHENPETINSTKFSMTFKARGWTEKLAKPTDKNINPPNKEVITKIICNSSPYEATGIMMILSALTILNENNKMPDK